MIRTVLYGMLLGILGYALLLWRRVKGGGFPESKPTFKSNQRYRPWNAREPWVQVYETASSEDAHLILARLQEEEVECLLYEQGKRDIQGNSLKGIGVAVPKSSVPLAQKIISRMPV